MSHAYHEEGITNLGIIKDAGSLHKSHWLTVSQLNAITATYPSPVYHPNFIVRILLFIVTLLGLSGITGLFALAVADAGETIIAIACIMYGSISLYLLEHFFIRDKKHFKSGVNEALLYHSCAFIVGGLIVLFDLEERTALWISLAVLSAVSYRYLDLISTLAALLIFSYLILSHLYDWGEIWRQVIPFTFIIIFTIIYWQIKSFNRKTNSPSWRYNLLIVETYSLLMIYLAGNYFVVRELSVNMMDLQLAEGENIPFAYLFYAFTIIIPFLYLFFGIHRKDIVILRTSLLVLAMSVFTFKYYYGFNQPEITLTIAGIAVLVITLMMFNYLKVLRNGFTRENLVPEKWSNLNAEAFIISQTLGGNQVKTPEGFEGQGGEFGGGGSTGSF